jgi:hypothetical protein
LIGLIGPDGKTFLNRGEATYYGSDATGDGVWTAPQDGTYYLVVRSLRPGEVGTYSIELDEDLDDYSNSPGGASLIGLDNDVEGSVQYSQDEDWFAIDAEAGQTYSFDLSRLIHMWGDGKWRRHITSSWSLRLNIFDQGNHELAAVRSQPLFDIRGLWTAPATGRYLIQVRTQGIALGYLLRVEKAAADANPPTILNGGESQAIDLPATDQTAHLRLIGKAGKKYWLQFPSGKVSLYVDQPYLADYGSGGWGWDDERGLLVWEVDRDSSLDVEFFANEPVSWLAYVDDHSSQPEENTAEETPPAAPKPGEKELVDGSDSRAFQFRAAAGTTFVFQTILGSLEDSTLTLYDSDGNLVGENDDVSDDDLSSQIEWTAEKSGNYFVVVGGFGGGSFDLAASEETGAERKELKLSALAVADARAQFGADGSSDEEEEDAESDDSDAWLSDDDEELNFSDHWNWGE